MFLISSFCAGICCLTLLRTNTAFKIRTNLGFKNFWSSINDFFGTLPSTLVFLSNFLVWAFRVDFISKFCFCPKPISWRFFFAILGQKPYALYCTFLMCPICTCISQYCREAREAAGKLQECLQQRLGVLGKRLAGLRNASFLLGYRSGEPSKEKDGSILKCYQLFVTQQHLLMILNLFLDGRLFIEH